VSLSGSKRPRFLLDLAEELVWLKNRAGPDVAEHWYAALLATIQFIQPRPGGTETPLRRRPWSQCPPKEKAPG